MNIKKITIFSIYITLLLILFFKQSRHIKSNDDEIKNIKLYNQVKKTLNIEENLNFNLDKSQNKYIRYIFTLIYNKKLTFDNKQLKLGNTITPVKNKWLAKIQKLNCVTLMKIVDSVDDMEQVYDSKLINIIISLDKMFTIKHENIVRETFQCYYDSDLNVKIDFESDVLFIQLLKSYGTNYTKNSILNKYQQLKIN